ncbi:hypothetical protein ACWET9_08860 [Streptomyces sp. NPDC004059]|uniref:hypothetical protein n=1 Tax=Streptomyces sp. NPDC051896 TaxID=3155416 RepID=UPI00342E8EE2
MPWSILPSMAAGRVAGAAGRRLGKHISTALKLPPEGENFTVKLCGAVLGGVASAVVSAILVDPVGLAGAAAANPDTFGADAAPTPDPASPSHGDTTPHFGYEGRYQQGVDHNGHIVIQSGTGGPVLKDTGQPVSPNDVTWG